MVSRSRGRITLQRRKKVREFAGRVYDKAAEDNIFFMAGAIAFNILVAVIPLLLLVVGVSGYVVAARYGDPAGVLVRLLLEAIPAVGGDVDLASGVRNVVTNVIEERGGLSLVGAIFFIWLSTRLIGTLRTVLREIFDVGEDRGIVRGKIFDAQIVLIGGFLLIVNVGITIALDLAHRYGVEILDLQERTATVSQTLLAHVLAFLSIWALFVLIYRFLPARWIPWNTALVAATIMAVSHELMKQGFSWYVTSFATYRSTYGNLTTVAILFFWIYYGSVVFILAGEIAQVWSMKRARKTRTARALHEGATG